VQDDAFGESKRPKSISSSSALSNRIFVVHGHDHATKTELEVFLTSLGIEPVVLHRQPDQGRTLIEKFEQHSDVGFAFILLTPNDVAYKADQETLADVDRKKEFRARPNVIFEFGYFVGNLGRRRVCCLVKGEVARPSDIDGLVYKAIPESIEAIGFSIIKELKAAGYTIKI
jgi:predicted nucleotide-binding protein